MQILKRAMKDLARLHYGNPVRYDELKAEIFEAADFLRGLMNKTRSLVIPFFEGTKQRKIIEELAFIRDTDAQRYEDLIVSIYGAAVMIPYLNKTRKSHLRVVR